MSRKWKKGFFFLTLGLSILVGCLMAKKTEFYQRFFEPMYDQTKDVMRLHYNPTQGQLYLLLEFLISFAVSFGLVWLLSFIIMRIFVRNFTAADWSLTREMQTSGKRDV